jgi:16S rRNA (cytosine1402-N4)-methyltransferase
MLREAIRLLELRPGMIVVDATIGCGGHAAAIMERIAPSGKLIGIDWDGEALDSARERLARSGWEAQLHRRNFSELKAILAEECVAHVDAVLFDLGVSSLQLGSAERGFSFGAPAPLDMRMDQRRRTTAQAILARSGAGDLERLFREYGEEPLARRIARALSRRERPQGTAELAELVQKVYASAGKRRVRIHPATRVFQALRIAVNDELENLKRALPQAIEATRPGGRIVVISFHSLEDRIAKETFSAEARGCECPPGFPVCRCGRSPRVRVITRKPLRPGVEEIADNPRARSARLRAVERI